MLNSFRPFFRTNSFEKIRQKQKLPGMKIWMTLLLLFFYRLGHAFPLLGIDQEAIQSSFFQLEKKNSFFQLLTLYSGGGGLSLFSPFSLGIVPYINASIFLDFCVALFPFLEKLQTEEGEMGRQKVNFYKKIATLIFSLFQTVFLIFSLKTYFFENSLFSYSLTGLQLITGSFLIVWLSNLIDKQGIGNGTSLIIFTNILVGFFSQTSFNGKNFGLQNLGEIFVFFLLLCLICFSQTARISVEVVSARQLNYLKKVEREKLGQLLETTENTLSIRLNQAGIFPLILASNFLPFFSFFSSFLGKQSFLGNQIVYYLLIISFNYFYTLVFWDPEKISTQLRKASVSLLNVTPGKETTEFLGTMVRSASLLGGGLLCLILFLYDSFKTSFGGVFLLQLNISSLIILIGIAFDLQRKIQAFFKKSIQEKAF